MVVKSGWLMGVNLIMKFQNCPYSSKLNHIVCVGENNKLHKSRYSVKTASFRPDVCNTAHQSHWKALPLPLCMVILAWRSAANHAGAQPLGAWGGGWAWGPLSMCLLYLMGNPALITTRAISHKKSCTSSLPSISFNKIKIKYKTINQAFGCQIWEPSSGSISTEYIYLLHCSTERREEGWQTLKEVAAKEVEARGVVTGNAMGLKDLFIYLFVNEIYIPPLSHTRALGSLQ